MSDVEAAVAAGDEPVGGGASPPTRLPPGAVFLLVLINVLWAGSAIPAKYLLGGEDLPARLGPFTLGFLRFAPSGVALYALMRARGRQIAVRREDRRAFLFLGALGLALTYGIFYGGMKVATATEATLLIAAEPILITLIAWLFLGERLRRVQSLGMAVGFAGVYVIVCQGLRPTLSASVLANAVVTLALCFESSASVLGKRLSRTYSGLTVLTVEMLVGAAVMLPAAALEVALKPPPALGAAGWLSLGYLALVCSFFCYSVWFWLLPRYHVSAMAGFLFIQPMMGPVYSRVFLGERIRLWTALGAGLVVAGVWLVAVVGERRRR